MSLGTGSLSWTPRGNRQRAHEHCRLAPLSSPSVGLPQCTMRRQPRRQDLMVFEGPGTGGLGVCR